MSQITLTSPLLRTRSRRSREIMTSFRLRVRRSMFLYDADQTLHGSIPRTAHRLNRKMTSLIGGCRAPAMDSTAASAARLPVSRPHPLCSLRTLIFLSVHFSLRDSITTVAAAADAKCVARASTNKDVAVVMSSWQQMSSFISSKPDVITRHV